MNGRDLVRFGQGPRCGEARRGDNHATSTPPGPEDTKSHAEGDGGPKSPRWTSWSIHAFQKLNRPSPEDLVISGTQVASQCSIAMQPLRWMSREATSTYKHRNMPECPGTQILHSRSNCLDHFEILPMRIRDSDGKYTYQQVSNVRTRSLAFMICAAPLFLAHLAL